MNRLFINLAVGLCGAILLMAEPAEAVKCGKGRKPGKSQCHNIIDLPSGKVGSWGQILLNEMTAHRELYTKKGGLTPFCKNFDHLNESDKLKAWLLFWRFEAFIETTDCSPSAEHPTHVRTKKGCKRINLVPGIGLWAMELKQADRKGRGSKCNGNMNEMSLQASCSVSIMAKQLKKHNVYSKNSYWGPVRRNEVAKFINRYVPCGEPNNKQRGKSDGVKFSQ